MNNEGTNPWAGKVVLITGVCGTVGAELLRQLAELQCKRIYGIDNNESELFYLSERYGNRDDINVFLGDIRDRDALMRRMRNVDVVLHAAALKHVILCEESPRDAVQTNVDGMINVIDAAQTNGVSRVLFTSSDKAVNPTNVMGTTKLMGERLMTSANAVQNGKPRTIFASTRFGNVLGSRGSVVPLFARQIAAGGPVTLTSEKMTRFVMTLDEAARLVLQSTFMACGGEVFVTKMPVVAIRDLARVMIDEIAPLHGYRPADIEISVVGSKPGEKLYEELLNEEEIRRTVELKKFFSVLPAFKKAYPQIQYAYDGDSGTPVTKEYNSSSEESLRCDELRNYLHDNKVFEGIRAT
jgi:FlaA1/EpsC-like NDP-sugar epimerase